jgi:hypothetical protein
MKEKKVGFGGLDWLLLDSDGSVSLIDVRRTTRTLERMIELMSHFNLFPRLSRFTPASIQLAFLVACPDTFHDPFDPFKSIQSRIIGRPRQSVKW